VIYVVALTAAWRNARISSCLSDLFPELAAEREVAEEEEEGAGEGGAGEEGAEDE
jgi:hypothetical protein